VITRNEELMVTRNGEFASTSKSFFVLKKPALDSA